MPLSHTSGSTYLRSCLVLVPVLLTLHGVSLQASASSNKAAAQQCQPAWVPTFGGQPGTNNTVLAFTTFDDGSGGGPALYAGGSFTAAGGTYASRIAKWDGSRWLTLGSGTNNIVRAMAVFDDGSGGGPALYAAGDFTTAGGVTVNRIAKWNGSAWSALGTGVSSTVSALAVFDDGSGGGAALYAGGSFLAAGGATVNYIARWNGSSWSALGTGLDSSVRALTVFDDGSGTGPALYAAGLFLTAGGATVNRIAKWNGSSWSALGSGVNGAVNALTVYNGDLIAGGQFTTAGGVAANRIAKWTASPGEWAALGSGMDGTASPTVNALAVFDDGSGGGPVLYAGGTFHLADGVTVNRIARWSNSFGTWTALGSGVDHSVSALAVFDDGSGRGPALCVGGAFLFANGLEFQVNRLAKWNGSSWSVVATGLNSTVFALKVFDDGTGGGPALYVGGVHTMTGGAPLGYITKWNGSSWSALGSGVNNYVSALEVFDDGSGGGPALFAGGYFTTAGGVTANNIAKWNGSSWSALGTGVVGHVTALTVFDDGSGGGPALYAGGQFTTIDGVTANNIAKWNGSSWSALGSGVSGGDSAVYTLAGFDDGSGAGPALYAGGSFTTAGGVMVNNIAKWNGTSWSALGSGVSGTWPDVMALTAFDDGLGGGPALYVGGAFTAAGGISANRIAKWNGLSWSPLGTGVSVGPEQYVAALKVFNDGTGRGPALYVGGAFTIAGGVTVNNIAKWNGSSWSALGTGMNGGSWQFVFALAVFNDGSGAGPALYAGGWFGTSPAGDSYIAKWQGCALCPADITGDGSVNVNDLLAIINAWGPCPAPPAPCAPDIAPPGPPTGDGIVNVNDLLAVINAWGPCP